MTLLIRIAALAIAGVSLSGCIDVMDTGPLDLVELAPPPAIHHLERHPRHRLAAAPQDVAHRLAARPAAKLPPGSAGDSSAADQSAIADVCVSIHDIWLAHGELNVDDQRFVDEHCQRFPHQPLGHLPPRAKMKRKNKGF